MKKIRPKQKISEIETKIVKDKSTNPANKKTIVWLCPELLLTRAKNSLISRQAGGDYSLTNFSDLIRQSLLAYQNGMTLTEQRDNNSPKKEISFRLENGLLEFYNSLPTGSRTAILERVLASYLLSN
ncbi:MAG: hypothetical protein LBR43_01100 [Spiroplasmataceae bacterium]|nr:hypothetical protein [Spiroplasmataceae bacterium]